MKPRSGWLLGLTAIVAVAYWNSVPGAFHYDDFALMLDNPRVTSSRPQPSLFLEQYGGRPLTLLTFQIEYALWGRNPVPFHLFNLLLHLLNTLLLFWFVRQVTRQPGMAFLAAAFFAVHPMQAQAVNYIWARSILLMSAFALGSIGKAKDRPSLSLLLFQLAIWSRAEAIVLWVFLVLRNRRLLKASTLLVLVNLALLVAGMIRLEPAEIAWTHSSPVWYWLRSAWVFWTLLTRILWPGGYSIIHLPSEPGVSAILTAWLAVFLLAFLALSGRNKFPRVILGMGWVTAFLAPSLLIPNSDLLTDSRVYLALAGFTFAFSSILLGSRDALEAIPTKKDDLSTIEEGSWRYPSVVLGFLLIAVLVPMTWDRNRIWANDVSVWREAVDRYPGSDKAHYNLAAAMIRNGEIEEAEKEFARSNQLNPSDDMSYAGLGYCSEYQGNWEEALSFYKTALELNPANDYAKQAVQRLQSRLDSREDEF